MKNAFTTLSFDNWAGYKSFVDELSDNWAFLFPDLDGHAASLKLRYNSLKTPEEVLKQQLKQLEKKTLSLCPNPSSLSIFFPFLPIK